MQRRWNVAGSIAVLGSMHGKERAMAPVLAATLGLRVELAHGLDTDRFGTFTRVVPRVMPALDTARAKALAAMKVLGRARLGLANEGSFGPHPSIPFVAGGVEVVLLLDRDEGIELTGTDVTLETNFASLCTSSVGEALSFAKRVMFPSHALVVMAASDGAPEPAGGIVSGVICRTQLEHAVRSAIGRCGSVWLETDMRAHHNPTRMRSIERATTALAKAANSLCPSCKRPGFVCVERRGNMPCAACGAPTQRTNLELLRCAYCGCMEERPLRSVSYAEASECPLCNP